MTALNIAFFVGEFPILSETFVIRQVAGLVSQGHRVTVIAGHWGDRACAHETYQRHKLQDTVRAVRPSGLSGPQKAMLIARFVASQLVQPSHWSRLAVALRAALQGSPASLLDIAAASARPITQQHLGQFDAIIAHFGPAGVRAMHLQQAGLLAGPLAVVFHGFDMSDTATLKQHHSNYQQLFVHAAKLLPISHLWAKRLQSWGANPAKIEVLRMGVDLDRLTALDPARPLQTPLRVLSVARFTEKKGLGYAIEGVMAAAGAIRYEIIGSGPLEPELKALAAQAPQGKEIVFLGKRSQQEVFAALEQADVFLLPSVTATGGDMEGIPVSLMEAMAKGVLVLATEHSGVPELVQANTSGLLVPERDAPAITRVLSQIAAGQFNVPELRSRALSIVHSEFNNAMLDTTLQRLIQEMSMAGAPRRGAVPNNHGLETQ